MWTLEGCWKWCMGVREPVFYDQNAYRIPTLPGFLRIGTRAIEWKRAELYGRPADEYMLQLERAGWKPVRSIFGRVIEQHGLRLMWRASHLEPERPTFERQLKAAQRGAAPLSALTQRSYGFADELNLDEMTSELAARGRAVDWGFDPYEGTNVEEALAAVEALVAATHEEDARKWREQHQKMN